MVHNDIQDIADAGQDDGLISDDLQELKPHGSIEFPVMVYSLTLSQLYLKQVRWHWHPEIELFYMLEGKAEALVDKESFILTPGQGIMINQNELHAFHRVEGYEAVFFSVVFHPSIIFGYGSAALSVKYLNPITNNTGMKCLLLNDTDPHTGPIIQYMKQVHDHFTAQEFGYEIACKADLCNLWNALLQLPRSETASVVKTKRIINDEQRIKDAIRYIEKHFAEPLTLDDISASIHISKSECCRCFQRVLRMSPFEYLLKYRIFYAAKLMQRHDPAAKSISNLAITVGFGNISYFNKVFKRFFHMTPTEYKKQEGLL